MEPDDEKPLTFKEILFNLAVVLLIIIAALECIWATWTDWAAPTR